MVCVTAWTVWETGNLIGRLMMDMDDDGIDYDEYLASVLSSSLISLKLVAVALWHDMYSVPYPLSSFVGCAPHSIPKNRQQNRKQNSCAIRKRGVMQSCI